MKEAVVVTYFKKYLLDKGWGVESIVPPAYIDKTNFGYIPDVLAHKGEDILIAEAKGSEGLRELQTAVGQAVSYYRYGGNIIVIVIPETLQEAMKNILENICFENSGKIGLFVVSNEGKVKEEIAYKRINLSPGQAQKGKEKIRNLTFIRDLKLNELKRLIQKTHSLKKNYNSGKELYSLLGKKGRDFIFKDRKTRGSLTEKSFSNALITTNNLGITENGRLTSLGISLALEVHSDKVFSLRLIQLLLFNGHFVYILREYENLKNNTAEKVNLDHHSLTQIVHNLNKKNLLKESIKNIDDYVKRMKSNQIQWLKDLKVIDQNDKINWTIVCDALIY